ncbi:MAG: ImmA/IrrE family metallo-endopeptidase [Prevotella sp.]|nr:ImmA/IrrE family metallo-endopeptidase [Prevotella sp.]
MNWRAINDQELENHAMMLRQQMQVPATEPIILEKVIRERNIIACFQPINEQLSGMAIVVGKDDKVCRFMLVNTNHQLCKQRFTACHELYHLLFQKEFSSTVEKEKLTETNDLEEIRANHFASALLMPEMGLRMLTPIEQQRKDAITMGTLMMLQYRFLCSHGALLYRLLRLGWISNGFLKQMIPDVRTHVREYGYNPGLYEPTKKTELWGDYNLIARRLLDGGVITREKYDEYLLAMDYDL